MAIVNIIPATKEHADFIAANVRKAYKDEMWAMWLMSPQEIMDRFFPLSIGIETGMVDGVPVCIWGVVKEESLLFGEIYNPWLVTTAGIEKHRLLFLKHSRIYVRRVAAQYKISDNYVDARNKQTIRWLKYVGFEVSDKEVLWGRLNLPFRKYRWRGSCQ